MYLVLTVAEPCPSGDTPPEKEIPSLFGALGLVRKPDNPALSKKGEALIKAFTHNWENLNSRHKPSVCRNYELLSHAFVHLETLTEQEKLPCFDFMIVAYSIWGVLKWIFFMKFWDQNGFTLMIYKPKNMLPTHP